MYLLIYDLPDTAHSLLYQMVYALSVIQEDGELFKWIPWENVEKLVWYVFKSFSILVCKFLVFITKNI